MVTAETIRSTSALTELNHRVRISRYGRRNWAVVLDDRLLAVVVYRKGARSISATLLALLDELSAARPSTTPRIS